jgi:hypothetical protein
LQSAACKSLATFLLKGNTFPAAGVVKQMEVLGMNNSSLHLDLSCRLSSINGESIGIVLRQNRRLRLLDLSWNRMTGTGAVLFARRLEYVEQLLQLLQQWNG